jgi:hypothetical protein
MVAASRESLHRAVDELPDESLPELRDFISYLRYKQTSPGAAWFREMYEIFEPVREEAVAMGLTEEDVNHLIDEAIEESRRERDA